MIHADCAYILKDLVHAAKRILLFFLVLYLNSLIISLAGLVSCRHVVDHALR